MPLIKKSYYSHLNAKEYFDVPVGAMWIEIIVMQFFFLKDALTQGMQTDISDLVNILFFPVKLVLAVLLGWFVHKHQRKKFYERLAADPNKWHNVSMNGVQNYTLDWKRYFSTRPQSWDKY